MWLSLIPTVITTITRSIFPDKGEVAKAIASADSKTSAAEIQDLISGSSRWRKWVAFAAMFHFLLYTSVYHIIPQILRLRGIDDKWLIYETDIHAHSMYISAGIVVISIVGREIVKLVRTIKG